MEFHKFFGWIIAASLLVACIAWLLWVSGISKGKKPPQPLPSPYFVEVEELPSTTPRQ